MYGSEFHRTDIYDGCYIEVWSDAHWSEERALQREETEFDAIDRDPKGIFRFEDFFYTSVMKVYLAEREKLSRIEVSFRKKIEIFALSVSIYES